jgi:hypothetical protein
VHQDKLEHKIVHLKEQVKALSKQMSKEEALTAIYRAESRALANEYDRKDLSVEGEGDSKKTADVEYEKPTEMEEEIGQVATIVILGTLMVGAITFFLLMYGDPKLCLSTWQTIENVAAIFLAVMWFQAFDDMMQAGGWEAHHEVLAALLHTLVLLSICVVLSWTVRDKHKYLTAFTAIGAHYISFAGLHFQQSAQDTFFSWHWALCLLSVVVFLLLLVGLGFLDHFVRSKAHMEHEEFEDSIDDVQNDVGGMILAFAWTTFVRYLILGRYPEHDPEPGEARHSPLQRGLLLIYAVLITVAAFFVIPLLDDWTYQHSHTASLVVIRLHHLCYPFITMSCAWAFLLWGEFEFYESLFATNAILARAVFALLCTAMCFSLLFGFSVVVKRRNAAAQARSPVGQDARSLAHLKTQALIDEEHERDIRRLVVNMLSLIIAFSWEETFDASVEGAVEGDAHPATAKVIMALVVAAVVLPVYVFYLRPHVDAIEQEVHPDGDPDEDAVPRDTS